jgi:cytochrome o ubiquinol oxidase subunit III
VTDTVITSGLGEGTGAEDAERAIDERTYGFWIYLMSDAIIFALLFAIFVAMSHNTADGPGGQTLFRLPNTFAETMLLLASSATFGFASVAIAAGQRWRTLVWLSVTFLLGLGFVVMKISELYGLAGAGAGPWRSGFLSAFFTLVGTHGAQLSVGLVWIVLLGCEVALRGLNPFVASRLWRLGLFWHFLDIVWIGIFSVVYLPAVL